ncbi:MAG: S41 family peptidase [Candidatus Comchoanobacterales bacterium]
MNKLFSVAALIGLLSSSLSAHSITQPIWQKNINDKLSTVQSISPIIGDTFKTIDDTNQEIPFDEMVKDIDTLMNALGLAYSGRNEPKTKDAVHKVLTELEAMKNSTSEIVMTYRSFHKKIKSLIQSIPDNHLYVMDIAIDDDDFDERMNDDVIDDTDRIVNLASGSDLFERHDINLKSGKVVASFDIDSFMIDPHSVSQAIDDAMSDDNVKMVMINLVDNGGGAINMVFEMWEHIQGGYNGEPAYFIIEDEINPLSYRLQLNQNSVFRIYYNELIDRIDALLPPDKDDETVLKPLDSLVSSAYSRLMPGFESEMVNGVLANQIIEERMDQSKLSRDIVLDASQSTHSQDDLMIIGGPHENAHAKVNKLGQWELNKPLVIITNKRSASASELFVLGFKHTQNVYHVGQSSMGCLHFMNPATLWLKNSSMILSVPTGTFSFDDKDKDIEIRGICPDKSTPTNVDLNAFITSVLSDEIQKDVPNNIWHHLKKFVIEEVIRDFKDLKQ